MIYGSVCSGIEAASVAWHPLGWQASFLSEIEPFPRAVLAHHYPDTPLHGDFTTIQKDQYAAIDLLVGGTPCQSFSVAGLRQGLNDPRGNLMLEFGSLARRLGPTWLVWENVPGVLSANGGRDFGTFLGMLAELGYGFAYRVLDAQYFGVAQRRRRVFVVGHFGDWRPAAAVLLERESVSGNPAPSREARKETAGGTGRSAEKRSHWDGDYPHPTLNQASNCGGVGASNQEVFSQRGAYLAPAYGIPGNWIGRKPENGGNAVEPMHDVAPCLTKADRHGVAQPIPFDTTQITSPHNYSKPKAGDACHHLAAGAHPPAVVQVMAVRRLTPVECERLQGFPDTYTAIPWRNKPVADCPDGLRYKALGNSMAVPVMAWIGRRIDAVSAVLRGK